jgi:Dna[CI] antecedent, DciA
MGTYHIADALKYIVNRSKLGNGLRAAKIEEVWEQVMGITIAKYTQKLEIVNKTLFITTFVGALKNELHFEKELIIKRINEAFDYKIIDRIVIK